MPMQKILAPYQNMIENLIKKKILQFGTKNSLRDACEYALLNGGKRFRPALVFMIAKGLGHNMDVTEAAMGIEFLHTASLIADDLPCMDNDSERRNKPSLHCVYGESVALLASYALISAGYACFAYNTEVIKKSHHPLAHQSDYLCTLAIENVSQNTGISGAVSGQYLDLSPPNLSLALVKEILQKKTVTLFEISFVLGWLFGGGDLTQLDLVKKSAAHFGMAFQIADDLSDMEQDLANQHPLNLANIYGVKPALEMFHEEISGFNQTLDDLKLKNSDLKVLSDFLCHQTSRY
ncbi:MAG: polyprenyl synthetase family protein [Parachlamydiaceae bacterium]|nr:polyprenyl synthetase family protein [Parachlamydiaceae bacterium]